MIFENARGGKQRFGLCLQPKQSHCQHHAQERTAEFITKTPRETTIWWMKLISTTPTLRLRHRDSAGQRSLKLDRLRGRFSKIYGMGDCVAATASRNAKRLSNCVRIKCGTALNHGPRRGESSLDDPDQVPNGRRLNSEARAFVIAELETMGYKSIPSQANFIMFDANVLSCRSSRR